MIEVKINGQWLHELVDVTLYDRELPILPDVRPNTLEIAGQDGEIDFGETYGPRQIRLTLMITATPQKYTETVAKLARIFKQRDIRLEFSDIPERIYTVNNNGSLKHGQTGSRVVDVYLKASDPWPESEEKVTEVAITTSPQNIDIVSEGDKETSPLIVLTNMGTTIIKGFRITNEYTIS